MINEAWIGILGGTIFYLSWVIQAWETKKANKPKFTQKFFWIRIIASLILLIEAIRVESIGFLFIYIGTIGMMIYNLIKFKNNKI